MAEKEPQEIHLESVNRTACHKCGEVMDVAGRVALSPVQCPQCKSTFSVPGRLGDFVLLKVLGKGEMGITFKGFEKALERNVAIKVMSPSLGRDRKAVKSFFAEARSLASLEHPNVARAYRVGQENAHPFIAMELIAGSRLDQQFTAEAPLDEARALEIGIGVAAALKAAHDVGLIHGDVKPGNIMLDEQGVPKLVDFGLARYSGRTAAKDALGTPYYVAPEVVRREAVDQQADMYSLGATLFHALTGRPPFPGETVEQVVHARLERPAPDVREILPTLHSPTAVALARSLQTDATERHQSYDEMIADLSGAYEAVTGTDEIVSVPVSSRAKLIGAGVGMAGVILAIVLGLLLSGGDEDGGGDGGQLAQRVATPLVRPVARPVSKPIDVDAVCDTPGASIHFTLDGSAPTTASSRWDKTLTVEPGTTLKLRAYHEGFDPSPVVLAKYEAVGATMGEAVGARSPVETRWDRLRQIERTAAFAVALDRGAELWNTGELFWSQGAYDKAKDAYEELAPLCDELEKLEARRQTAIKARNAATAAIPRPDDPRWADSLRKAETAFEDGEFEDAENRWRTVAEAAATSGADLLREGKGRWAKALDQIDPKLRQSLAESASYQKAFQQAEAAEAAGDLEWAAKCYDSIARQVVNVEKTVVVRKANHHVNLAGKLVGEGRLDEASEQAALALTLVPNLRPAKEMQRQIKSLREYNLTLADGVTIELARVAAGKFRMGSPASETGRKDDERQRNARVAKAFNVAKREVTRRQFAAFVAATSYKTDAEKDGWAYVRYKASWLKRAKASWLTPGYEQADDHPVVCVSWADARAFCKWASEATGRKVRLPTESEWEFACRGNSTARFGFGANADELHKHANYLDAKSALPGADRLNDDGYVRTAPAGRLKPNARRLYDMHGNVAEWVGDVYKAKTSARPVKVPPRVIRGGGWASGPELCRSAARDSLPPNDRNNAVGFRVVVETK